MLKFFSKLRNLASISNDLYWCKSKKFYVLARRYIGQKVKSSDSIWLAQLNIFSCSHFKLPKKQIAVSIIGVDHCYVTFGTLRLTNELVLCLFNIKFTFFCSQFLILHQKEFTTTSANKLLFRPFGESTDRQKLMLHM